ncbi:Arabinogalactan protein 16/20/22/41 [Dioscorea alata]|uniref:Arabinogalactan protein 16/20/22/41 n=1 Tax=Dioscorea alata TaxID=55571 RepID=A0ACB7W2N1_DIOAL|nr:Arabinogalactan protein 16/20/22/41 [Dioscorea alata]
MSSVKVYAHDQAKATKVRKLDGKAIDQGIAYGLMIAALFVTYLVH